MSCSRLLSLQAEKLLNIDKLLIKNHRKTNWRDNGRPQNWFCAGLTNYSCFLNKNSHSITHYPMTS